MFPEIAKALYSNPYAPAYTIQDGLEGRLNGHVVKTTWNHMNLSSISLIQLNGAVKAAPTTAQVDEFFKFLTGNFSFGASYRNVKDCAEWRTFYGVQDPPMYSTMYIDKNHNVKLAQDPLVPCRACGIVLPLKVITIDHRHPQTGGAVGAVCKVFRGLGLTVGGPKGAKSKQWQNTQTATNVGGTAKVIGSTNERYSLTETGLIYYTMFKEAGALQKLYDACMNNILNLRPVCGPCNSRLRNSGAF